jgi:hypothetical protein
MALTCPFMNRAISTPGILDICGSLAVYLELDFFHSTLRKLKFLIAVPETGFAVTAWGVGSLVPSVSTSNTLSCTEQRTLAIAPRSERNVCQFSLRLRSLLTH